MCRIAGIINVQLPVQELRRRVAAMCNIQQHGGPDDEGLYTNAPAGVCLGHRRLSIIDLSTGGHQPMPDVHKQVWITFNGEIYNFPVLKDELRHLGASFSSATDTEVIIQAYLYWGTDAFAKLKGMFAFALHDSLKGLTYLVRDRNGIKPLYYSTKDNLLSFASEVRALKGTYSEDEAWKIRFLTYGHLPEPFTTLKEVYSLPKGSYLCWNSNTNAGTISTYLVTANVPLITDTAQARELVNQSLTSALERQLIADAPLGVFLSGGLDSSLLALLANRQQERRLKHISVYFNERAFNERYYQEMVARQLAEQPVYCLVNYQQFEDCLPQIMRAMDMPTTDGINSWFISKYARMNGLKVVLSGLGADELFGGYPSFSRIGMAAYLRYTPLNKIGHLLGRINASYSRLAFLNRNHPLALYFFLRGMFTPAEVAGILDTTQHEAEQVIYGSMPDLPVDLKGPEKAGWLETNLYMQNQLLRDTDVMSMSHGLEVRVPFLDEDFTDAVRRIAPAIRFAAPPAKQLLLSSFQNLLPAAVGSRPKMGFTFPLQQWMQAYAPIADVTGYQGKAARKIVNKFNKGRVHWSKVYALYQLQQHA